MACRNSTRSNFIKFSYYICLTSYRLSDRSISTLMFVLSTSRIFATLTQKGFCCQCCYDVYLTFFFFVFRTLLYFQSKQARTRTFKTRDIISVLNACLSQLNQRCNSNYNTVLKLCIMHYLRISLYIGNIELQSDPVIASPHKLLTTRLRLDAFHIL